MVSSSTDIDTGSFYGINDFRVGCCWGNGAGAVFFLSPSRKLWWDTEEDWHQFVLGGAVSLICTLLSSKSEGDKSAHRREFEATQGY